MPHAIRKLIARGYWSADADGSAGGSGVEADAGNSPADNADPKTEGKAEDKSGDQDPGKGKTTDSEAKLLKEVMEKKNKLKEATDQLAQVKESLKQFEGLDPVAIRALLADKADRDTKDLEAKGAWDALKKQLVETHASELGLTKSELNKALESTQSLNGKIADLTVGVAFGQSKLLSEEVSYSVAKMRTFFGPHFEFDGEKVVGYDKPAGAKDRVVLMDAKGDPLPFEAALRKIIDADPDRDSMLKSKAKTGAGSKTDAKGGKAIGRTIELTGRERIAEGLKLQKTG